MKLDIIAQIVQILKDAPEVGAIEIRRGLFGAWSSVRVSKAGHGNTVGAGDVIVSQSSPPSTATSASQRQHHAPDYISGWLGPHSTRAPHPASLRPLVRGVP